MVGRENTPGNAEIAPGQSLRQYWVERNFDIRCSPAVTGALRGDSPSARQLGMHSMTASQFALWKKAIDCRRDVVATL